MKSVNFVISLLKKIDPDRRKLFVPDVNDIYLVSYPRSGNTWMRTLLTYYLYDVDLKNLIDVQYYVPDIYVKTNKNKLVKSDFHVVKTHEPLRYGYNYSIPYKKVIYMYRDPRDVVLSYHKYQSKVQGYPYDLDTFIADMLTGTLKYGSWQCHMNSWLESDNKKIDILPVKYEDLLKDTSGIFKNISNFIGIEPDQIKIQKAIDNSSANRMRKMEKKGAIDTSKDKNYNFIGKAKDKQWKDKLSEKQLEKFEYFAGKVMKKYGYND